MPSAINPVIERWQREGLDWQYIYSPFQVPPAGKTIPANDEIEVKEFRPGLGGRRFPKDVDPTKYREGIILLIDAEFNSPHGGIRLEMENFDPRQGWEINRLNAMGLNYPTDVWVPSFMQDHYSIEVMQEYLFQAWAKIHFFNTSAAAITLNNYQFIAAVLV